MFGRAKGRSHGRRTSAFESVAHRWKSAAMGVFEGFQPGWRQAAASLVGGRDLESSSRQAFFRGERVGVLPPRALERADIPFLIDALPVRHATK